MIAFGPVPSRRLGRSLGVNHIPLKVCSYACTYCQVGPTLQMRVLRRAFLPTAEIRADVIRKVDANRASGAPIDYISFVPDGEPTLDLNLGAHIRALHDIGIPIAVITNASLLWMPAVRAELAAADLVSVKVDAVREETWRRVNRPHGELDLERVLNGIRDFARGYRGTLISDTMLVGNVNDDADNVGAVADFLAGISPACAYLGSPTRPPASASVVPPENAAMVRAYEILRARLPRVELLPSSESGTFGTDGDATDGLLAILAVHPMREAAVLEYLSNAGTGTEVLDELRRSGRVDRVSYRGETFCVLHATRARPRTPRPEGGTG